MIMKNYFLGIDLGSSSIKVSILDGYKGKTISSSTFPENEMEIDSPKLGWAEQNPNYWWECLTICFDTLNKKVKKISIPAKPHLDATKESMPPP